MKIEKRMIRWYVMKWLKSLSVYEQRKKLYVYVFDPKNWIQSVCVQFGDWFHNMHKHYTSWIDNWAWITWKQVNEQKSRTITSNSCAEFQNWFSFVFILISMEHICYSTRTYNTMYQPINYNLVTLTSVVSMQHETTFTR